MKKLSTMAVAFILALIIIVLPSLTIFPVHAAEPKTVEEARTMANDEIEALTGIKEYYPLKAGEKSLNTQLVLGNWSAIIPNSTNDPSIPKSTKFNVFVYGSQHEGNGKTSSTSNHYAGYTKFGEDFPNFYHPVDAWNTSKSVEEYSWVKEPWKNEKIIEKGYSYSPFNAPNLDADTRLKYRMSIIKGLPMSFNSIKNAFQLKTSDANHYTKWEWENFTYVLQPPTTFSFGFALMWNNDGKYYKTILMAPYSMLFDFSTKIISTGVPKGQKAIPGQKYKAVIEYSLKGTARTAQAYIKAETIDIFKGTIDFTSKSAVKGSDGIIRMNVEKEWTCPYEETMKLESYITPQTDEENPNNNRYTGTINIDYKILSSSTAGGCFLDLPKAEGNNFSTWLIRAIPYTINEPVKVNMRIMQYTNLDEKTDFTYSNLLSTVKGEDVTDKYLKDGYIEFTPDHRYWACKITFPKPTPGHMSGILVQTGDYDIKKNMGVVSYRWITTDGSILGGSHTTSESNLMDWLPWDKIKKSYGITRGN